AQLVEDLLSKEALDISLVELEGKRAETMEIALILANILMNPTEEQKGILDAIRGIVKDQNEDMDEETKEAQDKFLQVAVTILLAQAMPDLFKEGEIQSMKSIFSGLQNGQKLMVARYEESVINYYQRVKEELIRNMAALQLKSILENSLTENELSKLPRREVDRILNKLREKEYKTYKEEEILRNEAEYKGTYLDPAEEMLRKEVTMLLEETTQRLFGVLDSAGYISEKGHVDLYKKQ
ncbi:MAG: hypothetical protein HQ579_00820, partial [Candidatus Omnitrophica bacterium]|nr:hypothetical protein [Candidatus Omnitrophota bacterium]